ncbi:chaplin family protein [Kitasatospora aureofaciens]|uniref:chaplin n=1 Tax=Kitasatospora aureofaciens TaxID=1894 RepID=UPI0037C5171E
MRNVTKKGILTAVATGSVLASTAGYAYAAAEAQGSAVGSPGVASGNSVQVPVEVPINACGNTVDVIGALNPAFGNRCANVSGGRHAAPKPGQTGQTGHSGGSDSSGAGASRGSSASGSSASGASASGAAVGSPGVVSGNSVQAPVHVPVNACGNSVDVVGVANPAFGNECGNVTHPAPKPTDDSPEGHTPSTPPSSGGETGPGGPRNGGSSTSATPSTPAVPAAARTSAPATPAAQSVATGDQLAHTGAGGVEALGAAGLALLVGGGVLYRRARAGAR